MYSCEKWKVFKSHIIAYYQLRNKVFEKITNLEFQVANIYGL